MGIVSFNSAEIYCTQSSVYSTVGDARDVKIKIE